MLMRDEMKLKEMIKADDEDYFDNNWDNDYKLNKNFKFDKLSVKSSDDEDYNSKDTNSILTSTTNTSIEDEDEDEDEDMNNGHNEKLFNNDLKDKVISDDADGDDDDFNDLQIPLNFNFHKSLKNNLINNNINNDQQSLNDSFELEIDFNQINLNESRLNKSLMNRARNINSKKKSRSSAPTKVSSVAPTKTFHRRGSLSSINNSHLSHLNHHHVHQSNSNIFPSLRNAKSSFNVSNSTLTAPTASSLAKSKQQSSNLTSLKPPTSSILPTSAKLLTKPRNLNRNNIWGDGTELDDFDDFDDLNTIKVSNNTTYGKKSLRPRPSLFNTFSTSSSPSPPPPAPPTISHTSKYSTSSAKSFRSNSPVTIPLPNSTVTAPTLSSQAKRKQKLSNPSQPPIHIQQRSTSLMTSHKPLKSSKKPTLIKHLGNHNNVKYVGDMKYDPVHRKWHGNMNEPALKELENTKPAYVFYYLTCFVFKILIIIYLD